MKTTLFIDNWYTTLGVSYHSQLTISQRELDLRTRVFRNLLGSQHFTVLSDTYLIEALSDTEKEGIRLIDVPEVALSYYGDGFYAWKERFFQLDNSVPVKAVYIWTLPLYKEKLIRKMFGDIPIRYL